MSISLDSITSIASAGLSAVQAGIGVLSDNIASAGVPGHSAKQLALSALETGGSAMGVRQGLISRSADAALQASAWSSASTVAALSARSQALSAINEVLGAPGDGASIPDRLAALQSEFIQLQSHPSSQTQQASVASSADALARAVTAAAAAINGQRNDAQVQIALDMDALNDALAKAQSTTADIITATTAGQSTAALEDARDAALQTISSLLVVHCDRQADGGIVILGQNGFSIPLDSRFSTTSATLSPGAAAAPPILMRSSNPGSAPVDVTARLAGGRLGEFIALRDAALPGYAADLDAFSAKLANKFSGQGLQLFTDATSTQPLAAYAGLSSTIRINPVIAASPALVRDGTPGSPFPLNPPNGPAGFSDLINRVVASSFAAGAGSTSLAADAEVFVAKQSAAASQATAGLADAASYQTVLSTKLSNKTGVDVDAELGLMIKLQNSYQANARVIQAAQRLFDALAAATAPL